MSRNLVDSSNLVVPGVGDGVDGPVAGPRPREALRGGERDGARQLVVGEAEGLLGALGEVRRLDVHQLRVGGGPHTLPRLLLADNSVGEVCKQKL